MEEMFHFQGIRYFVAFEGGMRHNANYDLDNDLNFVFLLTLGARPSSSREACHLECNLSEWLMHSCMSEIKPVWHGTWTYSVLKFNSKVCILNNTIFQGRDCLCLKIVVPIRRIFRWCHCHILHCNLRGSGSSLTFSDTG